MTDFRIITDFFCDLIWAQYQKLDVPYASLSVHFGTGSIAAFYLGAHR